MAHPQGLLNRAIRLDHSRTREREPRWSSATAGRSMNFARKLRVLAALLLIASGCRPAQIGPSDKALGAVDALYTAIASRRVELLEKSATRLEELRASGDLSEAAHRQLKSYIEKSRDGKWEAAIRELHEFIRGQRRAKS